MSHTPGPWLIEPKAARGLWLHDSNGEFIALATKRDDAAEEDANARLIAAAPDLLAALKQLTAGMNDRFNSNPAVQAREVFEARQAIAKATSVPVI